MGRLIPDAALKSVVAIGVPKPENQHETAWIASGFLYGRTVVEARPGEIVPFQIWVISNRHVFEGCDCVVLKFSSPDGSEMMEFALPFEGEHAASLHVHPHLDLAAALTNMNIPSGLGMEFTFLQEHHLASRQAFEDLDLSEGDFCYTLGYPLGLVGKGRHRPWVRHGSIARISDFRNHETSEIWIDCELFPGNSGGPVISKPETAAFKGATPAGRSVVFGVVQGHIPYRVFDVNPITSEQHVVFQENSGLAKIIPTSFVLDWIAGFPIPALPSKDGS